MKSKLLNSVLVVTVLVILGVAAFLVRPAATADSVVVLRTAGLSCASCITKVNKVLQRERGVAATEVDLDGGWVIAGYDSKQVKPERLAQQVSAEGFASSIQTVLTPAQFKKLVGRDIGQQSTKTGCCGSKGCGGQ